MRNLLSSFLILSFLWVGHAQNGVVKGKIIPEVKTEYKFIRENVRVFLCYGFDELSSDLDENLSFEFENIPPGPIEFWTEPFSKYNYAFKQTKLEPNDTMNLEIPIEFSCKYDQSIGNKTCPICRKTNRVIPIVYGLVISRGTGRKYKPGGCLRMSCSPNWYCKRDKIEF